MRAKLKPILIALAFVPVIVIMLIFLLNLGDEPLNPDLEKVLKSEEREPSESARRAHLYLLGLAAGDRSNPEQRGKELLPQTADRSVREALDANGWIHTKFDRCATDVCGKDDLTSANREILDSAKQLIGFYAGLMDFEDYAFVEPVLMIPAGRAHQLFTLQLAQWFSQGGEVRVWHALEASNHFHSRVLTQGPLLARMIALHSLVSNVRFVSRAHVDYPALTIPASVLESITLSDANTILGGAITTEMKQITRLIEDLRRGIGRVGLRPHETLNRLFDLYNQILFTDCPTIDGACVPALAYLGFSRPSHWLINPTGRYFATEVGESLGQRKIVERKLAEIVTSKRSLRAQ